ncbi:unnamed protein product [Tilletia laevis]|uniref:Major facilitator superfamily (MFS) profile domain-containing protein n=2 Tax=Tilletia TaxID=13289 RepID=A0A177U936_9BASI|nr:hypothetical protein CF336_g658 [Tilletia laevis]KAE8256931.1 hypothetical protein A4X03_0g4914 [Tilletia caries]KAE8208329.1 hypothetical protein CF335_g491 [Tilletia laevis]CAD6886217.1 unnamed protein product [Tilletia caries]CAD6929340.1 unnamed protein product [Tilletia laevis]
MVGGGGVTLGGPQMYPPNSAPNFRPGNLGSDVLPRLRGEPDLFIPLLAVGTLGIQLVWSTEMAFASPYLLELGLSKASMAAVFVAGPLSGLLVQPIVGALSDRCTHRWGRRRPYLAVAVALCTASLLLLGYARSLSHTVLLSGNQSNADKLTLLLAVVSIFGIDFSVNAVMSVDRALILDILPAGQQALGNAWAVRLTSVGLLLGFLIGNIDLPRTFPFSWLPFIWSSSYPDGAPGSEAQIKCMSVFTASLLLITHGLTAYAAIEKVYVASAEQDARSGRKLSRWQSWVQTATEPIRELRQTAASLPETIWMVFRVQFFNWVAMYPLLFWGTVWIGSIYRQQESSQPGETQNPGEIAERGTRLGSLAMFYQSCVSLIISIILPFILPATSSTPVTAGARVPIFGFTLPVWNVSLPSLWALSHFCFALSMIFTWPAAWWSSTTVALAVIAGTGFSVATSNWIPFSLLGILVHEAEDGGRGAPGSEAERLLSGSSSRQDLSQDGVRARQQGDGREAGDDDEDDDLDALSFGADRDVEQARQERLRGGGRGTEHTHAGAVLGLHNVSIVAGQLVVTAISSLVFALMDSPAPILSPSPPVPSPGTSPTSSASLPLPPPPRLRREVPQHADPDAIGMVLRIGMVSAAIAGVLALRLRAKMAAMQSAAVHPSRAS